MLQECYITEVENWEQKYDDTKRDLKNKIALKIK
jgi:hypothetical protein